MKIELDEMEKNIDELSLEELLDAMEKAHLNYVESFIELNSQAQAKDDRQYRAFRSRIIKMDAEKDKRLESWEIYHGFHMGDEQMIETITEKDKQLAILKEDKWNLKDEIRVKDARIAELEKRIDVLRAEYDYLLDGSTEAQDD